MTDTPNAVNQLYRDLLMQRSGPERLEMGCRMFDTARALMRAGLGDPLGTNRSRDMIAQLFLRTYATDFDPATREQIAAWLRVEPPLSSAGTVWSSGHSAHFGLGQFRPVETVTSDK